MDYKNIEYIVKKSKQGDEYYKEKLVEEFSPFIINFSRKTFIDGYDFYDIKNECFRILFKCIELYDLSKHRFVAYATNGIKQSIYDLIKKSKNRNKLNGGQCLIMDEQLENTIPLDSINIEDMMCEKSDYNSLSKAMNILDLDEKEFINSIYFENNSLRNYALNNNISYYTADKKKKTILNKMFLYISLNDHFISSNA